METSAGRAGRLLQRLFANLPQPIAFRLWDGSLIAAGAPGDAGFAVVIPHRATMRRLLRRPSALGFGEAYVDGAIDLEGDFFRAMSVAQYVDLLRPSLGARAAALWEAVRP
jgi:hypothetical protein